MKKIIFCIMIFMMVFLNSCKNTMESNDSSSYIDATPLSASINDADNNLPEDNDNADNEDNSMKGDCCWELFNDGEILVELMAGISYTDGLIYYPVRVCCKENKDFMVKLDNVRLNDHITADSLDVFYLPVSGDDEIGKYKYSYSKEWTNAILLADEQRLESFSAKIEIHGQDNVLLIDKTVSLTLPENYRESIITDYYRGVMADEQVIYESEEEEINLLAMGYLPVDSTSEELKYIICISNFSNKKMEYEVKGAIINGIYIDVSSLPVKIEKNKKGFLEFYISDYEFSKNVIDSISEISLIINSKDYSLSIANADANELCCPIIISGDGNNNKSFDKGVKIFEKDGIYLGLRDISEEEDFGKIFYYWNVSVINDSDEGVKISLEDVYVNGKSEEELDSFSKPSFYDDVAGHSQKLTQIIYSAEKGEKRPEIKCKFMVTDINGDKLRFVTDEEYTFN